MADAETVMLTLEKPVAGGRSLARLDGQILLVSGGIPGERVRAVIERRGKGVAFARVVEVEDGSADRITPAVDPGCGGLAFAHVRHDRQLTLKREIVQDALVRIARLAEAPPIAVVASPEHGWRSRARLHVKEGAVGYFKEGTHELCDAGPSAHLAPGLLALAQQTIAALQPQIAAGVEAVLVTQTVDGSAQAAHLELARRLPRHGDLWVDAGAPSTSAGVSAALATSRQATTIAGYPRLRESLASLGVPGDAGLMRHVAAFFQGNRVLLPSLVRHVVDASDLTRPVVDLYAGVGLFGIAIAASADTPVVCVEGDTVGAEDLATNAAPFHGRVRAVRGEVETFARQEAGAFAAASVVVDPPRAGLHPTVIAALAAHPPARLVYVSCDPATLARDLQRLVAAGMTLTSLTLFDLFPMTAHVETVAVLLQGKE
ncbi:MAG: class I SAM-dependent RNA methyltransferase [Luteitalea sp.]